MRAYWVNTSDNSLIYENLSVANFVFEFKVSKTIKGLESKAEEALNQIKEKQYDVGIKESGIDKIYRIELAFRGKKVKIKYELA